MSPVDEVLREPYENQNFLKKSISQKFKPENYNILNVRDKIEPSNNCISQYHHENIEHEVQEDYKESSGDCLDLFQVGKQKKLDYQSMNGSKLGSKNN